MPRTVPASAYETLGVSPQDDAATIRRTWHRKVRALYPDVLHGVDVEAATRKLAALNDAYDALCWHNPARAWPETDETGPAAAGRSSARRHQSEPRHRAPSPDAGNRAQIVPNMPPACPEALEGFEDARKVFAPSVTRTLRQA